MHINCPQRLKMWLSGPRKEMMKGAELLDKSFVFVVSSVIVIVGCNNNIDKERKKTKIISIGKK